MLLFNKALKIVKIKENKWNFKKFKIISIFLLFAAFIYLNFKEYNHGKNFGLTIQQKKYYYNYKNFSIIRRIKCPNCGFFSNYIVHLGCINKSLSMGYIPIIDLQSFPNMYNGGNTSKNNPFELFFNQLYNFTLEDVKKYAKNKEYITCTGYENKPNYKKIYYDNNSITFWHNFANKYMPLKNELMEEANSIMKQLFGNSKNILGILMRGTDYISLRPRFHPIPPNSSLVIKDVKLLNEKYKHDFIFFTTEDELIKAKFVEEFGNKLKMVKQNVSLNYKVFQEI